MRLAVINLIRGDMSGGYRKYLSHVLPRMARRNDVEAILCATPDSINVQSFCPRHSKIRHISCKPFNFLNLFPDSKLHKYLKGFSPNVLFVPMERSFQFRKIPIVNIIQNMEPFIKNDDFNPLVEKFRQWIKYMYGINAIKKSNGIIALSNHVSDYLIKDLEIPAQKIRLVYHGIDLFETDKNKKPFTIPNNWTGKFIFTAGSIRYARGLEDLIFAIKHFKIKYNDNLRLAIAGGAEPRMFKYQKKLKKWISNNNLSSSVYWVDNLNKEEMAWCYKNCKLFVMTSRVESFGMIAG